MALIAAGDCARNLQMSRKLKNASQITPTIINMRDILAHDKNVEIDEKTLLELIQKETKNAEKYINTVMHEAKTEGILITENEIKLYNTISNSTSEVTSINISSSSSIDSPRAFEKSAFKP